jgi:hypothetical protein
MDSQRIRIVGTKASMEWNDAQPNEQRFEEQGNPNQVLFRGMDYLDESALVDERLGLHVEGLSDAWSNIYYKFAVDIDAKNREDEAFLKTFIYPDIDAGLEGVRWIENCVRSAENGSAWVEFE